MPRDGSGIYSIPPGTQGVPDTTIESAKYNAYIADVEVDLNAPRPVIAGGTGAASPAAARDNLDAERSMQTITNFDADPLEAGSFYAAAGATGAPVAGHVFSGIIYGPDANNMVIEARDLSDASVPGIVYVREKTAGVWSAWAADPHTGDYVLKAGDTMTGNLKIQKSAPVLQLDRTDASPTAIQGLRGGLLRWQMVPGDNIAEAGANVGSNFLISRANDAGVQIDAPFSIDRATGIVTASGLVGYAAQTLTAAQKEQARKNIYAAPWDAFGWQNLLVNGSFDVLQEYGLNATATVPLNANVYVCDQWSVYNNNSGATISAAVTPYQVAGALGVSKLLGMACASAVAIGANSSVLLYQGVEGQRAARLNWGAGPGSPITICVRVYATIPGTAVLAIRNGASARSYCTPVTINAANTFEWKTVTIPPDSDSTGYYWDNRAAFYLSLSFGTGSTYHSPTPNAWVNGSFTGLAGQTNFFASAGNTVRLLAFGAFPGNYAPVDIYEYANAMRDYATETALARRYFAKFTTYHRFPSTSASFTSDFTMGYPGGEMRDAPTMTIVPGTLNIVNTPTWPFVAALDRFTFRHELGANAVGDCFANGNIVTASARF